MVIKFEECPKELQDEVNKNKKFYEDNKWNPKIVAVEKRLSTPYIDKSITATTYVVYVEVINVFETYKYEVCSKSEFGLRGVRASSMLAGDIAGFIRHSRTFREWFKTDWEEATHK